MNNYDFNEEKRKKKNHDVITEEQTSTIDDVVKTA